MSESYRVAMAACEDPERRHKTERESAWLHGGRDDLGFEGESLAAKVNPNQLEFRGALNSTYQISNDSVKDDSYKDFCYNVMRKSLGSI